MNETLEQISQREFGQNEFMFGFKRARLKSMAGSCTKKELKEHMAKLRGILKE